MCLDSAGADVEFNGNLLVASSFRQQLDYLPFAGSETRVRFINKVTIEILRQDRIRHVRGEEWLVLEQHFDGGNQMLIGIGFEDISPRACFEYLTHYLVRLVHRKDQHLRAWMCLNDLTCSFQPVQHRHADIDYGDVGPKLRNHLEGFSSIACFCTNFPIRV